jgi:hypothetical protein
MTRLISRAWLCAVVLGACLGFGCSKSGTFVVLDFKAGASAPTGVKSIDIALALGGKTAMTSYTAPGGGDITLPTSATLEIGSGAGALAVSATARDKSGAALMMATATGAVTTGSTTHVSVTFGGTSPDGGAGMGGSGGAAGTAGAGGSGQGGAAGEASDGGPNDGGPTDGGPLPALLAADKSMYDFGTQVTTAMGAAVGSTVITITNMGAQKSGTLIVGVLDSSTFPTSGDTCSGMTLDPGATCMVTVKFTPGTAGAKSSKLQVGGTPGGTVSVTLTGMGVDPGALSASPDHNPFDPLPAGQASAEVTFTVTNTGGAATTALTAALTGTNAGEFKLSTDMCTGKTLAGGATCTVGVEFAPTQAGTPGVESAVLSVSATTGGTATANLTGTLLGPASIAIVPTDQDFLMVVQGQTSSEYFFMVTNNGGVASGALTTGVSPVGEFAITTDGCNGMTLAPNGTCKIGVKMTPNGLGTRMASLNVRSTPGGNAVATLHGTGLAPGMIVISPQPGMFNTVDVGSPVTLPFMVTNTGGAPTTAITVGLTGGTQFTTASDGCSTMTLDPNASCPIRITFTPTTFGPASGMLTASATTGGTTMTTLSATGRDYVTLTATKMGTGGGMITATGLTCTNNNCSGSYPRTDPAAFQVVNLTATPDSLSTFTGWGGACSGMAGCQVTMSMAQSVTATFAVKTVKIAATVNLLSGQTGTVTTGDGAFTCSTGTCGPTAHTAQATISITATPGAASSFVAWSNGPCKGTNPVCTIPLTSDINITATFGPPNYMFVTSTTVIPGRLNGIAGADAVCTARATAAGLPGVYKAFISDNATNANARIGAGGWVRTDGRPFTKDLASLTLASNQIIYYPPRIDENGNDLGPKWIPVVTGSDNTGKSLGQSCNGATTNSWTQITGGVMVGPAAGGSGYWAYSQLDSQGCQDQQHLYCFRSDLPAVTVTFPPANVRRIFISDLAVASGNGIAAADAECVADATAQLLPNAGKFVALMATSTASAMKRVNLTGATWMRPDQVLVAATPADLAAGNIIAPIDAAADGKTYKNSPVWTGAVDAVTVGDATCNDWMDGTNAENARFGYPNTAVTPDWFNFGIETPCNQPGMYVICIEP